MNVEYNKKGNLEKILSYIEKASSEGAKLIVFPEQSLQGYSPTLTGPISSDVFEYQHKHAEWIPDGDSSQVLIDAAKRHEIYIV
jgi:predicted amidohydrolase